MLDRKDDMAQTGEESSPDRPRNQEASSNAEPQDDSETTPKRAETPRANGAIPPTRYTGPDFRSPMMPSIRRTGRMGTWQRARNEWLNNEVLMEENQLYEFVRDLYKLTPDELVLLEELRNELDKEQEKNGGLTSELEKLRAQMKEAADSLRDRDMENKELQAELDRFQTREPEAVHPVSIPIIGKPDDHNKGCMDNVIRHVTEHKRLWSLLCCLLILLLLLLILLLVFLLPGEDAPEFALGPLISSVGITSFGVTSQLDRAGMQHYVVVPSDALGELLEEGTVEAEQVRDVSMGRGSSALGRYAVACGTDPAAQAFRNLTVAVLGDVALTGSQGLANCPASSQTTRCLTCPDIQSATTYTVFAVPSLEEDLSKLGRMAELSVTTIDGSPPSFAVVPVILAVSDHSFTLQVELTEAGLVHYAVYHATVQVTAVVDVLGVIHSNLDPSSAQVLTNAATNNIGGLAAAGSIAVTNANQRIVTSITPPCVGAVCAYTAYGLPADTSFRLYLVAADGTGNVQAQPKVLSFRTPVDSVAPQIIQKEVVSLTASSFQVAAAMDEPGSMYFMIAQPIASQQPPTVAARVGPTVATVEQLPRSAGQLESAAFPRRGLLQSETGDDTPGDVTELGCSAVNASFCAANATELMSSAINSADVQEVLRTGCVAVELAAQLYELPLVDGLQGETLYRVYFITADLSPNPRVSTEPDTLDVRTLDSTPPSFVNGRPFAEDVWYTNFTLVVQLDEVGECSYVLLPGGAPPPSVSQVLSGTTSTGAAPLQAGVISVPSAYADATAVLIGLQDDTPYDVYLICQDDAEPVPNVMPSVTQLPVTTADGNPPDILSATVGNFTADAALLNVALSEAGVVFFQAALAGTDPPPLESLFAQQSRPEAVDVGRFVVDRARAVRSGEISNLESDTDYVVWLTAEDNVALPNRMTTYETVPFSTPDIQPPTLTARVDDVRGESFDLELQLDEAGSARCIAVLAGSSSPLAASGVPSARQIVNTPPATLFPDGLAASIDTTFTPSNLQTIRRVSPVASETDFDVYCGARDLHGNFDEPPTELSVTTLDISPPVFISDTPRLRSVRESSFGAVVQLNEPGRVYYVVQLGTEPQPSVAQVIEGLSTVGDTPVDAGVMTVPSAGEDVDALVDAVERNTEYAIYFVAEDNAEGSPNVQTSVTVLRVFTLDTSPPTFEVLQPELIPPSTFNIEVMLDEPGTVFYVCVNRTLPAPTADEVFRLSGPNGTAPELSGNITVTAAFTLFSDGQCNAPPTVGGCDVWAVAEDTFPPPDGPNRSPEPEFRELNVTGSGDFVCPPPNQLTRRLQPTVFLSGASPGFRQGSIQVDAAGTTFQQTISALNSRTPGSAGQVTLQAGGQAVPLAGSSDTDASLSFSTAMLPPAHVHAVLRSSTLVADLATNEGRKLSLAYQVWDRLWHSQVQSASASVVPVFQYIDNRPPSQPAEFRLSACAIFSETSGRGQCDLVVGPSAFPSYGSPAASATVRLEVEVNGEVAVVGESFPLQLQAAPSYPPLQEIGVVGTVPTRELHPSEEFVVFLEANTQASSLREWFTPIFYDTAVLVYVRASQGPLWNALTETDQPSVGYIGLDCPGAVASATAAQRRGQAVALATVTFQVRQEASIGTVASAIRIGTENSYVALVSDNSLGAPINQLRVGQIRDRRGGEQFEAEIEVVAVVQRGMLASVSSSELFNTAVLEGAEVQSTLTASMVFSWYQRPDEQLNGDSLSCVVPSPTTAFTVTSSPQGCALTVAASDTGGVSQRPVQLESGEWQAEVRITVWYPLSVSVTVADAVLNRVVDESSDQDCDADSPYQRSAMTALADWGGEGLDTIGGTDVTPLVSFTSQDEDVVAVSGAELRGVAAGGPVGVSIQQFGDVQATTEVSVSDEEVCVVSINVVGYTGATVAAAPGSVVSPLQRLTLTFSVFQTLVREEDVAFLRAYASFSDGSVLDVTDDAVLGSSRPDYLRLLPSDGDQHRAEVAAELGSPALCAPMLQANWTVCGSLIGRGDGVASVRLPSPVGIQSLLATPPKITRPTDPAAQSPISYQTDSRLSVSLVFSDAQVLDFSRDERTVFTLTSGDDLCALNAQTTTSPGRVLPAADSTGPGTCVVTVTFPAFNNDSLTADTSVDVVTMDRADLLLLHYDVTSLSSFAPDFSPESRAPQLRSIACSPDDYQQATLWAVAQLSDDTRHDVSGVSQYSSDDADVVVYRANLGRASLLNRVRPLRVGSVALFATFASFRSEELTIEVLDQQPATIAAIRMQGVVGGQGSWCTSGSSTTQCRSTFLGVRNSQETLEVEVELDDGYTYTTGVGRITGAERESLDIVRTPLLLQFGSSVSTSVTVAEWGDAQLLDNHWAEVEVGTEAQGGCVPTGESPAADNEQIYANLAAAELDVDLGQQYGPQFQADPYRVSSEPRAVNPGDRFVVPVVLNSASDFVTVFDIDLNFDDALIEVASPDDCVVGSSWPNARTLVCVTNSPPNQVRINAVDSNVVASMRSARVELARVTFTARAAGLAEISGMVVEVKQESGEPIKDRPIQAGEGSVSIGGATSRRRRLHQLASTSLATADAPRAMLREKLPRRDGALLTGAPLPRQRSLLQSECTIEAAQAVPGDVNFDCIFDLAGDVLAVDELFGAWNNSSPASYYAALAERSANTGPQSINSGVTEHQRSSLDPMLRYYSGLPPSDPNYIPRPDGSFVPDWELYAGISAQPGNTDDKFLMQLIKADVQFFLIGAFITPPSRASKELIVEIELINGDGSAITSGDSILVKVEVNSTQPLRWTNEGAEGGVSIEGNPLATATFLGGGRWRVSAEGDNGFVDEPSVGLVFFVLSLDSSGDPIATSFYPYYGTSQTQVYLPITDDEGGIYKSRFTPYTFFDVGATCTSFLPGFPTVVDIQNTAMQLEARLNGPVFRLYYIVVPSDAELTPTQAQIVAGDSLPQLPVFASGFMSPDDAGLLQANISDLPATANVTVYLVTEEFESEFTEGLLSIEDILLRDTSAPSFAVVELNDEFPTVDEAQGTFSMSASVQLDEPATVFWAVYRNLSCIVGDPSLEDIQQGASLQPPVCLCEGDGTDCGVVDYGTFEVSSETGLASEFEIAGDLSPLPFRDLVDAPESELRCFSGSFGPEASDTYNLYLWARDHLPTHNTVEPRCDAEGDASGGPSACSTVVIGCDQPLLPQDGNLTSEGTVNWQAQPFFVLTINSTLTGGADEDSDTGSVLGFLEERPVKVEFSLESTEPPAFIFGPSLPFEQQGSNSLWMAFELDRPGLVTYVVSNFTASGEDVESGDGGGAVQVANGRTVVLNDDPDQRRVVVNITACDPNVMMPQEDYLVQVVARDKHGRTQGRVIRRLTSTQDARR